MVSSTVPVADVLTRFVAWHLGQLHAWENALALVLAFGPFVVLAVVIVMRRRDDEDEDLEASD